MGNLSRGAYYSKARAYWNAKAKWTRRRRNKAARLARRRNRR